MKSASSFRFWAPVILLGASAFAPISAVVYGQANQSATQSLLERARGLEMRGRSDMAAQIWQQVLLVDPNNTQALGGLARAAKLNGNLQVSANYVARLRAISPNDPAIAQIESMQTQQDKNTVLREAGKLAEQGEYGRSMDLYRQAYGTAPPAGEAAVAYYETEAASPEARGDAIAGLRRLLAQNPQDTRYQIALGRILTYNPKTREEGRRLLKAHPLDARANEALRQSYLWDVSNPASAAQIRGYLSTHNDRQLADALNGAPKYGGGRRGRPLTAADRAYNALDRTRTREDRAAYRALNEKKIALAEKLFMEILAKHPDEANALAGMGYVRMQQTKFAEALTYLLQAQHDGSKDPGIENALATSRFWNTMAEGALALNDGNTKGAEENYRKALAMRSHSPEALEGLGGTLLKEEQPAAAIAYFVQYIKEEPNAPHAWRGLFLAQMGTGDAARALDTEKQFPPRVRVELARDPLFLRQLATAYTAVGRDGDAQRVLKTALELPLPESEKGFEADTQLQYAALLEEAHRLEQAAGYYKQILAKHPNYTDAWEGLVRVQHLQGHDELALQTVEGMPAASYAVAIKDAGFEQTVASIYQTEKRYDVAENILETAVAQSTGAGKKPLPAVEIQLAGIYLLRGNAQAAYPLYRKILTENPDRLAAWKGLLSSLHDTNQDRAALSEVRQIPAKIRAELENDVEYLQTVAAVYNALGETREAEFFLRRVQQHYAAQHAMPPTDVDIQNAWLLYNGGNDAGLYRQLMTIGDRADLTGAQRRTVQTIWTEWAVRRANQASAAGNTNRALAILNATARTFGDNPAVIKALASGYARAGMSKQAVMIWKAQDMNNAPAADYKAAVGAALAAEDMKDAEMWLRFGLEQYPKDPQMLILAAKFEEARGDTNRAADFYHASLDAMPPVDPGAELASELSKPVPVSPLTVPNGNTQDLAGLLAPGPRDPNMTSEQTAPVDTTPYLPGYGNFSGRPPVLLNGVEGGDAGSSMTAPTQPAPVGKPKLKDYVPQASVDMPEPRDGSELPVTKHVAYAARLYEGSTQMVLTPAVYQQHHDVYRVARPGRPRLMAASYEIPQQAGASQQSTTTQDQGQTAKPADATYGAYVPYKAPAQTQQPLPSHPATQNGGTTAKPADETFGPYVPYKAPAPTPVQLGNGASQDPTAPQVTDVLPSGRQTQKTPAASRSAAAAARRREANQKAAPEPGGGQVAQPGTNQPNYSAPAYPEQNGESQGQQYPQPNVRTETYSTGSPTRSRVRRKAATTTSAKTAPLPPAEQQPAYQGLSYPGVGQSLSYQPYPLMGPAYPLGVPPTDGDLLERTLPPLRGPYYRGEMAKPALTERQQAELDLETLEGSYSPWIGATGSARYRSGTPGIDRLTDLEATFEASTTVGNNVRLSVVPKAVFLNSGQLDTLNFITTNPVLGTLPGNAANAPQQQFTNGVGGEVQVATRNFAAAVGYTPYEFLVRNVTARVSFTPNRHFTLFGDRSPVTQTQLSYAGLRDPGSATPVFSGNIWGGVMSTGGGVRMDFGNEKAGFYLSADGADLTGYHVLENNMFEGSAGAYFLAHTWPGYGRLNIGASMFGMHYAHNERIETYGQGGYFSPEAYFLASVPVTWAGRYGSNFHYTVAGSLGVQTFQEDNAPYFPLDKVLQNALTCTNLQIVSRTACIIPQNSVTSGNYSINTEGAYKISEHWFGGGFMSANNTNNYNTITGGFFVRYLFRPQHGRDDYPTGLFPVEGFRPLRVP